ncbi:4-aminobutyrate aminotransferase-like enzyme [Microbacterium sp. SORGH_AS 1204]|uniref:aspartate aminotransferase family protein n=1 Tax=Microbacterium sp. SORGH_AS_1204 TaxID=3041785 RepID=UPI00279059C0|nr:aminotransferase class III-fold pyridoxal phosphate-dependent enzyme [Microbacterium sp. SORGH_AS_1204]MDQ1135315.1 4-aminobutyrate aminotransferase-like enzyme [Microbacterium sp. SORGH_AS_1204]
MNTTSSILDGNSFRADAIDRLDPLDRALVERRARVLGPSYRLFYREPLHLVRAQGTRVYDAHGREYLDAYNNVASVGHGNPAVVAAVQKQMTALSTHSRYLQDGVVDYAERLLSTLPAALDRVMFTNSGSEANDLALRVARYTTGGTGVVVTSEAYHGTTSIVSDVSPSATAGPLRDDVIAIAPPDPYRHGDDGTVAEAFATRVAAAFDRLAERGHRAAALLVDSIFSSDGVFPATDTLEPAFAAARAAGALVIADEVQPGFARVGEAFWGFARHGVVPDIVTMGKPMGNGVPVAAMVASSQTLDPFGAAVPYFNTFGGSSVPIAAARAVLDEIVDRQLDANAERIGEMLRDGIADMALRFDRIGDIRSAGVYFGVELVEDRQTRVPASGFAQDVINFARDEGLLISVCGPTSSTLKIRPMLTYTPDDAALLLERLERALNRSARAS